MLGLTMESFGVKIGRIPFRCLDADQEIILISINE